MKVEQKNTLEHTLLDVCVRTLHFLQAPRTLPVYTVQHTSGREKMKGMTMTVSYVHDFGPFDGRIWLNCAHQGPLPRLAIEAAQEALSWKIAPYHLTDDLFTAIPFQMREALGRLVGVPANDIILGHRSSNREKN
jgi:hypothetical protein